MKREFVEIGHIELGLVGQLAFVQCRVTACKVKLWRVRRLALDKSMIAFFKLRAVCKRLGNILYKHIYGWISYHFVGCL